MWGGSQTTPEPMPSAPEAEAEVGPVFQLLAFLLLGAVALAILIAGLAILDLVLHMVAGLVIAGVLWIIAWFVIPGPALAFRDALLDLLDGLVREARRWF
jgi:Flp pilus assembly protein TadB